MDEKKNSEDETKLNLLNDKIINYCYICNKKAKFGCGDCGEHWYCSWKCRTKDFFIYFHWARCPQNLD